MRNRRPAGQSDGSDNLSAIIAADRAFPAAVAELAMGRGRTKQRKAGGEHFAFAVDTDIGLATELVSRFKHTHPNAQGPETRTRNCWRGAHWRLSRGRSFENTNTRLSLSTTHLP